MKSKVMGFIMDPIEQLDLENDSTTHFMRSAEERGWDIKYMEPSFIYYHKQTARARMFDLRFIKDGTKPFEMADSHFYPLHSCDVIVCRVNPPFNQEYLYLTYLLELAKNNDTLVINDPNSLRDFNEKLIITKFPDLTPPTMIAKDLHFIRNFIEETGACIIRPMESRHGREVFHVERSEKNLLVLIDALTHQGTRSLIVQKYVPEAAVGDKYILMLNGEPLGYSLVKSQSIGTFRGGFDIMGRASAEGLTDRDRDICAAVGDELVKHGIFLAGLDIIGDYLIEVNFLSPGGIVQYERLLQRDIMGEVLDKIEEKAEGL